jgi:hypothetical protein
VVPDDKSHSSGGGPRAGGFVERPVSAGSRAVCAIFQCADGTHGTPLAESILRMRIGSQPPMGGISVCGTESGASQDGGVSRGISLAERGSTHFGRRCGRHSGYGMAIASFAV